MLVHSEMLIAFAHTGSNEYIQHFLKSVEGHELWQLTDESTPALPGCQVARFERGDKPFILWRAEAYAALNEPGVYLDTDLIVQRNLEAVMALDFDAALAKTKAVVRDPEGVNLTELMPYNGGVVFVKNPEFWPSVVEHMLTQHPDRHRWYGDQFSLAAVAKRFNIIELPNTLYNYTPKLSDIERNSDLSDKWILHFKGKRKEWMPRFAQ